MIFKADTPLSFVLVDPDDPAPLPSPAAWINLCGTAHGMPLAASFPQFVESDTERTGWTTCEAGNPC